MQEKISWDLVEEEQLNPLIKSLLSKFSKAFGFAEVIASKASKSISTGSKLLYTS